MDHSTNRINTIYYVDFDHTISRRDVWDAIVKMSAPDDWQRIIQKYLRDEITSLECNRLLATKVCVPEQEAREMVLSIGIDPTFHTFVDWTQRREAPIHILSDGYDYYIQLLLEKEQLDWIPYFCNRMTWKERGIQVEFPLYSKDCERGMAHCKCQHIKNRTEIRHVYIGDGISDTCAAPQCDTIYAKRNLLEYCRNSQIPHTPFENFLEIIQNEEKWLIHNRETELEFQRS